MAFIVTGNNKLRLTVFCQYGNQVSQNVFHYNAAVGAAEGVDGQELADLIVPVIQPQWADIISMHASFQGIKLEKLLTNPVPAPVYSAEVEDGTITGDPLPSQCTGITSWRTALAGKSNRGRTYWPFPAEADNNVSELPSDDYMTRAEALSTKMMNFEVNHPTAGAVVMELQIHTRILADFNPVTNFSVKKKWATQRRRGQFGQTNALPF